MGWPLCLGAVCCVYFFDVTMREWAVAARAKQRSQELGKPILNIGSGTDKSSFTGAKLRGHVNCDLAAPKESSCGLGKVCHCNAQDLSQFKDKEFGVALCINTLRYVPDKRQALAEMARVADVVIVSTNFIPWMQLGPGPKFGTLNLDK